MLETVVCFQRYHSFWLKRVIICPMAAIFETIEKGLAAWGFDLCQPFAGWSLRNRVISSGRLQRQCVRSKYDSIDGKRDDVGNSGGTNMCVMTEQVGNSRNHSYTKQKIQSVVSRLHIRTKVLYSCHSRQLPLLNFQLIAEVLCMQST